ncbi:MAG TPA: bifunctional 3-(3-hydroxy-phenyl)propionate/3-hydroxycinnamic acid hydroxylase [Stellaceae bacterium]|nr:bifunctional 3-(3-hydroxy-phenyl)propionate/3-hydroxycinnamic acid hydroxylase [Stellaceae bacterium]
MYDVVIVGYGPTGMLAAILLGRAGHRVAVVERYRTLYNLPRVGIVHDDVLRMFQEVGCVEDIWPATHFLPVYELAKHGQVLLSSEVSPMATHGWPEYTSIYQPSFEKELDRIARAVPSVEILSGETATSLDQGRASAGVTVTDSDGQMRRIEGRFVIGADGGNSFVRRALGVEYENLGFDQDWLVIDAKEIRARPDLPAMRQFCEPEQPGVTLFMGPHHRRWSFMIFPGESPEDAIKPESVWRRLDRPEGATPDEYELVRVASYKFQSLYARQWRVGRVFLAGDAAHQMPPFLAQGLCSGFRDAHNLAWKLDLVLKDLALPDFLDTYMAERGPSAHATIVESMRVGQHVNERDPEKVKLRDEQLMAMQAEKDRARGEKRLIAFRVPGVEAGFIARGGVPGAGDAFPQARVRRGRAEGRFDDVAGRGFIILARGVDLSRALGGEDRAFWQRLGGSLVTLADSSSPASPDAVIDAEGLYGRLMDEYRCDVIVKRPDYYMFGACRTDGLKALIADLREQLRAGASIAS